MRSVRFHRFCMLFLMAHVLATHNVLATGTDDAGPAVSAAGRDDAGTEIPFARFNDPILTELVNRAMKDNPGIDAANARIDMAEAVARTSLVPLRPTVFAEGGYLLKDFDAPTTGAPASALQPEYPSYMQSVSAALVAKYELDITGRYRKARDAAFGEVSAAKEDVQAQGVAIATLVVQNYFDAVAAKRRVELIEGQIENYEKLLQLVMAQFDVGTASSLDVLQQKAQLESKKAQLPLAVTIVESGKLQLAALLNTPVSTLPEISSELPQLNTVSGIPGQKQLNRQLLESKPSLRAARIRIDALKQKEDTARLGLYPSLGFLAKLGYGWNRIDEWVGDEAWQLGATLTVPIYMGGATRAGIAQAKAATRSAEYALENDLIASRTEVLMALEREKSHRAYLAALRAQTDASELTVQEATRKYMAGLSNYLNVLSANDILQLNQLNLIQAERNLLSARVSLMAALGGNWTRKLVAD